MNYKRIINLPESNSFFLLGPRGVGKSTLMGLFINAFEKKRCLKFDLLDPETERNFYSSPERLLEIVDGHTEKIEWIFIDQIQKIPKLLDVIHKLIFEKQIKFALTGSSARKLRRDASNLLAGRAFSLHLHPLTFMELKNDFILQDILSYGSLPEIFKFKSQLDKRRYLF